MDEAVVEIFLDTLVAEIIDTPGNPLMVAECIDAVPRDGERVC